MNLKHLTLFFLLAVTFYSFGQDNLAVSSIPQEIKENTNAVVRSARIDIVISSRKSMKIKKARSVTVFNEKGMANIDASEYYEASTQINSMEAIIYNASGEEIKKIKKKDFKMRSVSDGSITDNKMLYLDYTPIQYPFTITYTSEIETINTAFMPPWSPVNDAYVGVENSVLTIQYKPELGFRYKAYNFAPDVLEKQEQEGSLTLSVKNIKALKWEDHTPYQKTHPVVLFTLNKFHLEGVDGETNDWKSFGGWMYKNLVEGTDEVPAATRDKIKALVGTETDPLKKAKIVYEYVQSKTRYISIQLGIGGWRPMLAKDVDRLGYGDCKALSNYTRALLKVAGVESYYTVIYAGSNKKDMREDFVSMQGNHVILAIPHNGGLVWLECTSQSIPFGFQGDFTDDRMALLVKPEGGELVRTHIYDVKENTQASQGSCIIGADGALTGSVKIVSKGTQYDNKYFLASRSPQDVDEYYKSAYRNINNLKLKKTNFDNKKESQEFIEDISIEAAGYCNLSGNRLMFAVNAFNVSSYIPQRYRTRNNPFEIERGYYDTDEITISLPEGYELEAMPSAISVKEKFGEYKSEYIKTASNTILYKRELLVNQGYYEKNDYDAFRQFMESIVRNDNAKVVLIKK